MERKKGIKICIQRTKKEDKAEQAKDGFRKRDEMTLYEKRRG